MGLVGLADRVLRHTPLHGPIRGLYRAVVRPRRILQCYLAFVAPGELAFDIGANVGSRTGPLLRLGARVVAVEPQPHIARVLRIRYGSWPGFTLVEKAIGAAEGTATMYVCSRHDLTTLSRDRMALAARKWPDGTWRELPVPVTTLDALVREHGRPRFVKIDVEGMEADILRGLSSPVGVLSFEVTPERSGEALLCLREIDRLGPAEFNVSIGEEMRLRERWLTRAEIEAFCRDDLPRAPVYGDIYARPLA
jgi:FkbM family methyltransferase